MENNDRYESNSPLKKEQFPSSVFLQSGRNIFGWFVEKQTQSGSRIRISTTYLSYPLWGVSIISLSDLLQVIIILVSICT